MYYDQAEFDIRFEWGEQGVAKLAPLSDLVIIVDVLSFTTCVEIAVYNGAIIFPYLGRSDAALEYARNRGAELAAWPRQLSGGYSLSPASLQHIPPGARLVLPSPNGATLSLLAGQTPVVAGCLRNNRAVAEFASRSGRTITVVAAGERWWEDGRLRPALEDLLGAGAIISHLRGSRSPEAVAAVAVFRHFEPDLVKTLKQCASGKELIEKGFTPDVELAGQVDCSSAVPVLREGAFVNQA
jgi:2-phosphosulfolactate phosphatase